MSTQFNDDKVEITELDQAKQQSDQYDSPNSPYALALALTVEEREIMERRLKRKLDFRLLFVLFIIFIMNYLDRNNIAASKVAGLSKSLHLTSTQYSTCVSLLFLGYVIMQVPSNLIIAHVRPSLYLGCCMAVWGVISACTGTVHSYGGLLACRFFLGFVESAFYPGALFLLSTWYKRSELGKRMAFLFGATQIGSAFSGLIGAGINARLNHVRGLESWRWIFIIEGSITVFIALVGMLILPDYPSNTRFWMTETERSLAQYRLAEDIGQADVDNEPWQVGVKLAFKDFRLYVFAFIFMLIQCCSAVTNFFPSVVQTLGFNNTNTLLMSAPPYFISFALNFANNVVADHRRGASLYILWPLVMAITGYIIALSTLNTAARYVAFCFMIAGGHGANAVTLAWVQKTLMRPRIKRAASVSFVNAFGNIAQVFTAYLYPSESAPRYVMAFAANLAFAAVCIIVTVGLRVYLTQLNHKLDNGTLSVSEALKEGQVQVITGERDEQVEERAANFRFVL